MLNTRRIRSSAAVSYTWIYVKVGWPDMTTEDHKAVGRLHFLENGICHYLVQNHPHSFRFCQILFHEQKLFSVHPTPAEPAG